MSWNSSKEPINATYHLKRVDNKEAGKLKFSKFTNDKVIKYPSGLGVKFQQIEKKKKRF